MTLVKAKIKTIVWWLIISLLVGSLFSFYHWTIPRLWGITYYSPLVLNQTSPSFTVDETIFYASKAREILDGNWWLSDGQLKEYKRTPSPFVGETVPAVLMAGLAKITGGIEKGFMLADFIFPALIFLSLSWLLTRLSQKPYLSMLGALLVMFGFHYLTYFPYLPSVIKLLIKYFQTGSYSHFIRSFHPQVSFGLFVIFGIIYLKTFRLEKKEINIEWWLGWLLGVLVYTYLFYWSFAFAWVGVGLALAILNKNKNLVKKLSLGLVIGLMIGLVYWLNLYWFGKTSLAYDFKFNSWFETPWRIKDILLVLVLLASSLAGLKNKALKKFWLSFFLTSLMIIIGAELVGLRFDDPVGHWLLRVVYPISIVYGFNLLFNYLKSDLKWLSLGLCLLVIGFQAKLHFEYFKNQAEAFSIEPERLEMFQWLNQNTQKNSVVLTDNLKDNLYLPVYTHNNVFVARSQLSLANNQERVERFLIALKLNQKTPEELEALFDQDKDLKKIKRFKFENCGGVYLFFRKFNQADYYNCSVPDEVLEQMIKDYNNINLEIGFKKYKADYWLTNQEKQIDNASLVWENKAYKLWQINQ